MTKYADKPHGGGDFSSLGTCSPLAELLQRGSLELEFRRVAVGQIATQGTATLLQVDNFRAVGGRPIGLTQLSLLLRNGNFEALDELRQAAVGELLLLVRGVAGLVRAQAVTFDGLGQDDRG